MRTNKQPTELDRMYRANLKLVDELADIKRDMMVMVNYFKGDTDLKGQVEEITEYYDNIKIKG